MRRAVVALALCASVVLGIGAVTFAHEGIASSEPKPGERVDRELRRVVVTFGVEVSDPTARLVDPDEDEVPATLEQTGPDTVVLEFQPLTRHGQYIVQYLADGVDGHEVTGAFAFTFRSSGDDTNVLMQVVVVLVGGSTVAALVLTWWYRRSGGQRHDVR